jgi:hypothetical protein
VKRENYESHNYVISLSITLRKNTKNSDYQVSQLRIEISTFRREVWSLASRLLFGASLLTIMIMMAIFAFFISQPWWCGDCVSKCLRQILFSSVGQITVIVTEIYAALFIFSRKMPSQYLVLCHGRLISNLLTIQDHFPCRMRRHVTSGGCSVNCVDNSLFLYVGQYPFSSVNLIQTYKPFVFLTPASRLALGPTQPPIQWVLDGTSPGVKWQGLETDHAPPSSAEVKNDRASPQLPNMSSWHA